MRIPFRTHPLSYLYMYGVITSPQTDEVYNSSACLARGR